MDEVAFEIPGKPVAKGRPRARVFKKKTGEYAPQIYTPKATSSYEQAARWAVVAGMRGRGLFEGAVTVRIRFFFPIPKSWPKYRRKEAAEGKYPHSAKPDLDNVTKTLLDCLNGLAFKDDAQVVQLETVKLYSDEPRTEVEIQTWRSPRESPTRP